MTLTDFLALWYRCSLWSNETGKLHLFLTMWRSLRILNGVEKWICDVLRDLVPFVQFKKCENHRWVSLTFSRVAFFISYALAGLILSAKFRVDKSSHPRFSITNGILKNLAIFTEKRLCWSLFLVKLQAVRSCNYIKTRLQHRCFPVNIVQYLRTPIL